MEADQEFHAVRQRLWQTAELHASQAIDLMLMLACIWGSEVTLFDDAKVIGPYSLATVLLLGTLR